jgi:small GTP-binding protein
MDDDENNFGPRIIFIGDSGVGKTSIIHRLRTGNFLGACAATVGTGVTPFSAPTELGPKMFQLWDTAGQEVYRKIIPLYFHGADTAVVVFALSDPASYANLDGWVDELYANTDPGTTTLVVGNKSDLGHRVSEADVRRWGSERNFQVLFCSALSGEGIDGLKHQIIDLYVRKMTGKLLNRIELNKPAIREVDCC